MSSNFFTTSLGTRPRSEEICFCFGKSRLVNCSHKSPSTTCWKGKETRGF